MDEDWELLVSFLPSDWRELAERTGALKGLRKYKSVDNLLRMLLIHLGCGHSLRETVVRARQANLADLSDVALLKRLRKSKDWLYALCVRLFQEHGIAVATGGGFQIRAFDATTVKEPGKTERCGASTGAYACRRWRATSSNSPAPRGRAAANHWRSSRSAPAITYSPTGVTRPPAVSVMRRPPVVDSSYGSIPVHYHCAPDTANRSTCSLPSPR